MYLQEFVNGKVCTWSANIGKSLRYTINDPSIEHPTIRGVPLIYNF